MEHIDVEKKILEIRKSLVVDLKRLGAIDENGNTKDANTFERVIDKKIKEINALEPMIADETGVVKDRYAANIFFHQQELLNQMRKNKTINIDTNAESLEIGFQKETKMLAPKSKNQIFRNGIKKLFQKFSFHKREIENGR